MKRNKTSVKNSRDPLSAEELTVLEAGMEHMQDDRSKLPPHDRSEHAHIWRFLRNHKLLCAVSILLALLLLAGLVVGVILLIHHLTAPTDTQLQEGDPITVTFFDRDPMEFDYDSLVKDGVFYIDMMTVADCLNLKISGTEHRLCFEGSDESRILFEHEKTYATINGFAVTISVPRIDNKETSPAPALVSAGSCLVPVSFMSEAVESGFSFKLNSETNTLRIRRVLTMVDNNKENAIPSPVLFTSDPFEEYIFPEEIDPTPRNPVYSIDISSYEKYILAEELLLVNKNNPLKSSHEPNDLSKLTCPTAKGKEYYLKKNAARALSAMMAAMKADGVTDVYVTSAYRSYARQEDLYDSYVQMHKNEGMSQAQAEKMASTYSARAGESEHQSGLCIDFTTNSMNGALETDFEDTDAFLWLSEHAWEYGFILRYPESEKKVAITGYDYEPWHYRFVGRAAAEEIDRRRLTLEEYLGKA
ncbi:MAG: M15 family metallopeptidase [Clostridia bacterium]|nr:M15 family metallopeptidase [Clostridia bacterium]